MFGKQMYRVVFFITHQPGSSELHLVRTYIVLADTTEGAKLRAAQSLQTNMPATQVRGVHTERLGELSLETSTLMNERDWKSRMETGSWRTA